MIFRILVFMCLANVVWAQDSLRVFGLIPPDSAELAQIPFAVGYDTVGAPPIPRQHDLTALMPPVGDQGSQGSCAAWTIAYELKSYYDRLRTGQGYLTGGQLDLSRVHSPAFMFNYVKLNRVPPAQECRMGMTFVEAFNVIARYGSVSWQKLPYNKNSNGCLAPNPKKDAMLMAQALPNKLLSPSQVSFVSETEFMQYIAQGVPIVVGVSLDQSFTQAWSLAPGKYIWKPAPGAPSAGYHAMLVVGYDRDKKEFKVMNSWGTGWGMRGYMYVNFTDFLSRVREAYITYDASELGIDFSTLPTAQRNSEPAVVAGQPSTQTGLVGMGTFSNWVKEGYYREYNGLRIGILHLDDSLKNTLVKFSLDKDDQVLHTLAFRAGEAKQFQYKDYKVTFQFDRAALAGRRKTYAVFYTLTFERADHTASETMERLRDDADVLRKEIERLKEQLGIITKTGE